MFKEKSTRSHDTPNRHGWDELKTWEHLAGSGGSCLQSQH